MKRNPVIPLLIIIILAVGGTLATVIAKSTPLLGLDLKGGLSVVLVPDRKVDSKILDQTIGIIRSRVDSLGVAEPEITRQADSIVVQLPGVKDPKRALEILGQTAELRFRPVLGQLPSENAQKLEASKPTTSLGTASTVKVKAGETAKVGGTTVATKPGATTVAPSATTAASVATTAVKSPATTISPVTTKAVGQVTNAPGLAPNQYSVSAQSDSASPDTAATGTKAATTAPSKAATTAVATTAVATATSAPSSVAATTVPGVTVTTQTGVSVTTQNGATTIAGATTIPAVVVPPGPTTTFPLPDPGLLAGKTTPIEKDLADQSVILPLQKRSPDSSRYALGPTSLTGAIVKDAQATVSQAGSWAVDVELNAKGTAGFNQLSAANCEKQVAIVLDGVVKSAPVINKGNSGACSFPDGRVQITGNFQEKEARDLATVLRFGSLPVTLKAATSQNVSATIGRDSLNAGLITGLFGLFLVALYMIAYYRLLGAVVVVGLLVSGGLMWSIVSFLSRTQGLALSLSGVVGIIVSVGVTVDSYVVFFERMRDEIRNGKPMRAAVERGFKSAWRTILAADLTSFIGALVLYVLTVGSVRGFAFFLMLSTFLDMIVSYFFTRNLVEVIATRSGFTGRSLGVYNAPDIGNPANANITSGVLRPSGTGIKPGASTSGGQS